MNGRTVAANGLERTDFMEEAAMLVLTRKEGQRILIDNQITLIVTRICGNRVAIGIEAPANVAIQRDELLLPAPHRDCSEPGGLLLGDERFQ